MFSAVTNKLVRLNASQVQDADIKHITKSQYLNHQRFHLGKLMHKCTKKIMIDLLIKILLIKKNQTNRAMLIFNCLLFLFVLSFTHHMELHYNPFWHKSAEISEKTWKPFFQLIACSSESVRTSNRSDAVGDGMCWGCGWGGDKRGWSCP